MRLFAICLQSVDGINHSVYGAHRTQTTIISLGNLIPISRAPIVPKYPFTISPPPGNWWRGGGGYRVHKSTVLCADCVLCTLALDLL